MVGNIESLSTFSNILQFWGIYVKFRGKKKSFDAHRHWRRHGLFIKCSPLEMFFLQHVGSLNPNLSSKTKQHLFRIERFFVAHCDDIYPEGIHWKKNRVFNDPALLGQVSCCIHRGRNQCTN